MSEPSRCPDAHALQQALLGQAAPGQAEAVARHLESCGRCATAVQGLTADDSFVQAVRGVTRQPAGPPQELLDRVIRNLVNLRPAEPAATEMNRPALAEAGPPGTEFLALPQGPDELGRLGGYRVLKVLGSGGMGLVLEAEDVHLQRRVALKVMRSQLAVSASARQRFVREAVATAKLQHDHVVTIHQVGEDRGVPFLAMQLLQGESLEQRLQREGRLPPGEVLRIGREIAEGLAAAHRRGLMHRDVKPANVWLEEGGGRVKILDFGLARAVDDDAHLTREGALVGTPAYVAPEQALGRPVDPRCDLFSLGCVLYRLATGRLPFQGSTTTTLLLALATERPRPAREHAPDLPAALDALIMRLLAHAPADRPASAGEVVAAIAAVERDPAVPPPLPAPVRRSRRPVAVAAGLAALAAAAAAVLAAVVLTLRTPDGTLVVTIDDKDVEARYKDGELRLYDAEGQLKYTLKPSEKNRTLPPGEYRIEVTGADGLKLSTDQFEMKKNGLVTVRVLLDPNVAPAGAKDADPGKPVPADKEKPFLLLRAAKPAGEFKTLAGLLAEIRRDDEVEIHGNGPFPVGPVRLDGQGLVLRAGAGYRPRLEMAESVVQPQGESAWFTVRGGGLTVEGCDLVGTTPAPFFQHTGGPLVLRRCRLLRCHSLGAFDEGPAVRLEECYVHCYAGLQVYAPGATVEVTNSIAFAHDFLFSVGANGPSIRLHGSTLGLVSTLLVVGPSEPTRPANVELTNNLVVGYPVPVASLLRAQAKDWQPLVRWQGHDNLYAGAFGPPRVLDSEGRGWAEAAAAPWEKVWAGEKDVRQAEPVTFAWGAGEAPTRPAGLAALRQALADEGRRGRGASAVGPDLELLGPGEAVLKAAEKAGKPIPKGQLRPEAEEGGPFVLLHGGKVVRGFNVLREAFEAAADGDAVEVRTDGPRPVVPGKPQDGVWVAVKGTLTLRAGPGYRPVLTGRLLLAGGTRLTVEGLDFKGDVTPNGADGGQLVRAANCSIDALDLGAGGEAAEILNSVVNRVGWAAGGGGKLVLRNSVVGGFEVTRGPGESALELERCAVWHPGPGLAFADAKNDPKNKLVVTARATLFEAGGSLIPWFSPTRWDGTGNAYRVGLIDWKPESQAEGAGTWRRLIKAGEGDDCEADPVLADPRQWRLPPQSPGYRAGPGGKDYGADVDRVAVPLPAAGPAR